MKYSFLTRRKKAYPVGIMCRLLGVTRSVYYGYLLRRKSEKPDEPYYPELLEAVRDIAKASDDIYARPDTKRSRMYCIIYHVL